MKNDIKDRGDIEKLMIAFYSKATQDDELAIIFNEVVKMDWEHHIPVIVDFWEGILLNADTYHRNAMEPHFDINRKYPLRKIHFERWLQLFSETVNNNFEGTVAALAITRAKGIAGIMQIKMDAINKQNDGLDT
jgi:hemoglobin